MRSGLARFWEKRGKHMSRRIYLMGQLGMLCMLLTVMILILFMTGCGQGQTMPANVGESTEENGPIEIAEGVSEVSTEASTDESTDEPAHQTPESNGDTAEQEDPHADWIPLPEGTPLSEAELAEYQVYFEEYDTWYTQALTSFYESPRMMDLRQLFYNGFPEEDAKGLTDAEQAYIDDLHADGICELDTSRIPVEKMDQVLQQYFGITLEETAGVGLDNMPYWEETNCYYSYRGDTNSTKAALYSGTKTEDGTIVLYYTDDWKGDCMIEIRLLEEAAGGSFDEDGETQPAFQILSHVPLDMYDLFYQKEQLSELASQYMEALKQTDPLRESTYEIRDWVRRGNQYEVWVKEYVLLSDAADVNGEASEGQETIQWHTVLVERQADGRLGLVSGQ